MESTAFNRDEFYNPEWSTLHSITMHVIHCIPSGCFGPCLIKSTEFNRDALGLAACTPLHTIRIHCATMHGILAFIDAACNPMYSIGMLWAILHKIHFIPSRCMESTAFNRDAFYHAAWITLHSIMLQGIHCIQSGCFEPCCLKSTAFNQDAFGLAAWTPLHKIWIHCATMHGILCIQ